MSPSPVQRPTHLFGHLLIHPDLMTETPSESKGRVYNETYTIWDVPCEIRGEHYVFSFKGIRKRSYGWSENILKKSGVNLYLRY